LTLGNGIIVILAGPEIQPHTLVVDIVVEPDLEGFCSTKRDQVWFNVEEFNPIPFEFGAAIWWRLLACMSRDWRTSSAKGEEPSIDHGEYPGVAYVEYRSLSGASSHVVGNYSNHMADPAQYDTTQPVPSRGKDPLRFPDHAGTWSIHYGMRSPIRYAYRPATCWRAGARI
jgi:hypothetical protein